MQKQLSTPHTRQWIQTAVLLGLGFYFLFDLVSGKIALYVNDAQFGWVPWVGAALFLSIGAIQAVDLLRPAHAEHDEDCDCGPHDTEHAHHHDHEGHDHNHEHSHAPSWLKLALVSVPLAIGIFIPAKPLGASAISTSGISSGTGLGNLSGSTAASFNVAPTDRTVLDWIRAFSAASDVNQFNGQAADLTGFVYKDIRFQGKPQFMVARFVISCCVADASAIGVTVQSADADKWQADSWVHVTGKFTILSVNGAPTPVLVADSVKAVAQPDHPYLYP